MLIFGGAGIGMAFMAQGLGGTVLQVQLWLCLSVRVSVALSALLSVYLFRLNSRRWLSACAAFRPSGCLCVSVCLLACLTVCLKENKLIQS